MIYQFHKMTTEALIEAKKQIKQAISDKLDEKRYVEEELKELRKQNKRAENILIARKRSPYNGEHHVLSEFRLRYKKPFSELSVEEKRTYHHEYWERYGKEKRKAKKEKTNNG